MAKAAKKALRSSGEAACPQLIDLYIFIVKRIDIVFSNPMRYIKININIIIADAVDDDDLLGCPDLMRFLYLFAMRLQTEL